MDAELKKARDSLSGAEDIPTEYLGISDPDAHLETLQNDLKVKQSRREAALTSKTAAASKLESYKENISGDPTAEAEKAEREKVFAGYQINDSVMAVAKSDAMVQHCLPAHREEEITAKVFEAHAEEIFAEAENRLHAQKAVLVKLMG